MGSLHSKIPSGADNAVKFLQHYELGEILSIFEQLSHKASMNEGESSGIDKTVFGEYFAYPGVLRDQIFVVFDTNHDGLIDREEFLRGVAMCCKGRLEDKLNFCFSMFDLSGDGYVDRCELSRCLQSTAFASFALLHAVARELPQLEGSDIKAPSKEVIHEQEMNDFKEWLFSSDVNPSQFEEEIASMVDEAFKTCDINCDGRLSLDEFRTWMFCTPEIVRILYGVFEMRNHVDLAEIEREFQFGHHKSIQMNEEDVESHLRLCERQIPTLLKQNVELGRQVEHLLKEQTQLLATLEDIAPDVESCIKKEQIIAARRSWSEKSEIERQESLRRRSFADHHRKQSLVAQPKKSKDKGSHQTHGARKKHFFISENEDEDKDTQMLLSSKRFSEKL